MHTEPLIYAGIVLTTMVSLKLLWRLRKFPYFLTMEMKSVVPLEQECTPQEQLLSVIIPANNEEATIERVARSVLKSECADLELVLIDDRSSDNTARIMRTLAAEDGRVRVLSLLEIPPGWTGKSHALFRGAELASGGILLFVDADSVLDPNTIRKSRDLLLHQDLDMLSLLPGFTVPGFIEGALYPILALGLLYSHPLWEVNDPTKATALASGAFIMMTRKAYEKVGTWRSISDQITEDIALAREAKRKGLRLKVMQGNELVQVEPFPSLPDLLGYWKRVYYGGFERSWVKIAQLTTNHASLFLVYVFFAVSTSLLVASEDTVPVILLEAITFLTVTSVSVSQMVFLKRQHVNPAYGLAAPLGSLLGTYLALSILMTIVRGRSIWWHGTSYK